MHVALVYTYCCTYIPINVQCDARKIQVFTSKNVTSTNNVKTSPSHVHEYVFLSRYILCESLCTTKPHTCFMDQTQTNTRHTLLVKGYNLVFGAVCFSFADSVGGHSRVCDQCDKCALEDTGTRRCNECRATQTSATGNQSRGGCEGDREWGKRLACPNPKADEGCDACQIRDEFTPESVAPSGPMRCQGSPLFAGSDNLTIPYNTAPSPDDMCQWSARLTNTSNRSCCVGLRVYLYM